MAAIELHQLAFRYPGADKDTLADLSLRIDDGEAHALLGASGSGKTTLLNLLSGLLQPSGGSLQFDGVDVGGLRGRDRRVSQVFQFPVLYEGLDVAENLAFPLRAAGADAAEVASRTAYVADELRIGALLMRSIGSLSLFEKQLVAVGKALMRRDVAVVLLDEPLTAVEPKTKWRLRQTLRRVQADTGVTMVYVTHDQTEALTFADRVSVLAEGRILQTGTPEQIYAAPAHEYVGHFVGSPGMNFLPGPALGLATDCRVGFRPEWVELHSAGVLRGEVVRVRPQGTRQGQVAGISMLRTPFGEVAVRGALAGSAGDHVSFGLVRYLVFRAQRLVEQVGHE